jgi:type I restriction enzyme S subunit
MKGWRACKLGTVIEIIGGGTPKTSKPEYWNGDIPWLSVADFNSDNKFVYQTEKTITDMGLQNSSSKILNEDDIVISARGTVGALAVLKKKMAFNQSCYGIRSLDGVTEQKFLYYLIKDSINNLRQVAHGGVFDTITRETFNEIDISLPSMPEQRNVAQVLSSLDDKIDLLHQQNKTLEGMAEALWRKMFVEEADAGWEETSLFDAISLVGGGTPKTDNVNYWSGNIKWISAKDISPNHKRFILGTEQKITDEGLGNSSTKLLPQYATVISARGTVGKICLLSEKMAFSQSNYGVLPKYEGCYFFTYLLISHLIADLQNAAYGCVFDTITTTTFKDQKINLPGEFFIKRFENTIAIYFIKMLDNSRQIRALETMRDMLLPRMMSGEMRVK